MARMKEEMYQRVLIDIMEEMQKDNVGYLAVSLGFYKKLKLAGSPTKVRLW